MDHSVPQPIDECIAALHRYGVLDTSREPALDQIVAAAASFCKVRISAINFVDEDRQWTKAATGLDTEEIPSEFSACAHTIQQGDILIVTDLSADARFSHHPAVVGAPYLKFYAGVPLETADGHRIGTLCILAQEPGDLADEHKLLLKTLARNAMTELELRRALAAERQARLEAERLAAEKDDLLARNDVLVREIDHRVKNSLQLIASMLSLQSRRLPEGAASRALADARQRIAGIAAVHDQLYRASDTDLLDSDVFLTGLCAALAANRPDGVRKLDVAAGGVTLNSRQAMRLGLLATELVTNAFKHAYPEGRRGDIRVALTADDGKVRLSVSDDGIGLPDGFSPEGDTGLGMKLIRSTVRQSGGTFTVGPGPGAAFTIDIPREPSEA